MVKLLENTFRAVNIGLVNEIAQMCHKMDIDVWEVIDAAKTKPFGFMPFYPGPGLGGHCIPIDPFYLSWKARQSGFECRFIELAGHVNASMPDYVVERVADALNTRASRSTAPASTFTAWRTSATSSDMRESPALDIIELLLRRGAVISYSDPYVATLKHAGHEFQAMGKASAQPAFRLRRHLHRPLDLRLAGGGQQRNTGCRYSQRAASVFFAGDRPPVRPCAAGAGHRLDDAHSPPIKKRGTAFSPSLSHLRFRIYIC